MSRASQKSKMAAMMAAIYIDMVQHTYMSLPLLFIDISI